METWPFLKLEESALNIVKAISGFTFMHLPVSYMGYESVHHSKRKDACVIAVSIVLYFLKRNKNINKLFIKLLFNMKAYTKVLLMIY